MPQLRRGLFHFFPNVYSMPKTREMNALQRDEFVKRVQEIGKLGSREEVERAIQGTLEILKRVLRKD